MGLVLVASGTACIAVVHPLNSSGKFENESPDSSFVIAASYLDEFGYTDDTARNGLRMMFHSKHRPLEAYSRALEASGFGIESIREHPIPEEVVRADRSRRWRRIPLFLHVRARKPAWIGATSAIPLVRLVLYGAAPRLQPHRRAPIPDSPRTTGRFVMLRPPPPIVRDSISCLTVTSDRRL